MSYRDVEALMQEFVKKGPAGCAIAFAQNGETMFEGYYGLSDVENGKPVDENSLFRLFSMTKLLTCSSGLIQFERGQLLMNDPISEYLPEYKHMQIWKKLEDGSYVLEEAKQPILVRHCFNMAVGMYSREEGTPGAVAREKVQAELLAEHPDGKWTHIEEIRKMASVPMLWEPGTRWQYGFGHELVNALVEVTSGKSLGEFMRENIFEPLDMKSAAYRFRSEEEKARMMRVYARGEDGSLTRVDTTRFDRNHEADAVYESGGTGVFCNLRDYLRFSQMLANGGIMGDTRIMGRKTIDMMRSNMLNDQQLRDFRNSYRAGYGYGYGVRTMMDLGLGGSNGSVGDFGWTGAAGTWVTIDPTEKFSAVYMHQMFPNMEEYHHLRVRAAVNACIK